MLSARRRRLARISLRVVGASAALYAIACVGVAALYRPFLFPAPHRAPVVPADAKMIETRASDGATVHALRFGPDDAPAGLVFFHGNGELADDDADLARVVASRGYAVVLAEYRGYGMSAASGAPSEHGIYEDAAAAIAKANVPNDHLVLMGFSLGTGVAVEMAARGYGKALVLLAPYTSIPEVASRHVALFPMNALMRDEFDTVSKAPSIDLPVLVAHGDRDEIVPFDMGETVAHAFPRGRFVTVSGAHHTDMFARDDHLVTKLVDFLIDVVPL